MRVTIRPLGLQQAAVALIVLATATCDSEPTSPPGPRPQVRPVADVVIFHARNRVSPPVSDTLIVGDTLRLAAAATDANGHVVLGVQFAWMSSDTLVAVVDAAGLVTGIGSGEAEVTATTAGKTGRLDLTVFVGQPPGRAYGRVVLPGTVWESADVITAADPSALDSVVYVGRGMRWFFPPLEGGWRDLEVFLLAAHFAGGTILEVQAHPAYVEADSALAAAKLFLPPIGRLPRVLIDGAREVELSPESSRPPPNFHAGSNSCGNLYHWEGDLRRAVLRIPPQGRPQAHYVEEVALHEGGHAVLDDCPWDGCHDSECDVGLGNPTSAEWRAAQAADSVFITLYALEHPEREDMAETLWAWFVSRCVPDRLHPEYKRRIDAGIPHRLAYLDRALLGLDLRPWQCSGPEDT